MRYEIDKDNAVKIFRNNEKIPFLYQPDWPDFTPWTNSEEAKNWAEVFIYGIENPDSKFIEGNSPDNHPILRPKINPETGEILSKTEPESEA